MQSRNKLFDININLLYKFETNTNSKPLIKSKNLNDINYKLIRNTNIWNSIQNSNNTIDEELTKSRKLKMPYSENYFNTEKIDILLAEYSNTQIGNTPNSFITYYENFKDISNEVTYYLKKISDKDKFEVESINFNATKNDIEKNTNKYLKKNILE